MTRHFDFRDDGDEPRRRICDDLAYVVLRIEPAITLAVVGALRWIGRFASHDCLIAPAADFRELGILRDLEPPALIVGEMPVKAVELMNREEIEVFLDELLRHEVARRIEMRASPGEAGCVLD